MRSFVAQASDPGAPPGVCCAVEWSPAIAALKRCATSLLGVAMLASPSIAQPPRDATLIVTVVDQTRAVIPAATVTVTGLEDATKSATIAPGTTSEVGVATIRGLKLGRYLVAAEFPGFQTGLLRDVRLRAGENKQTIILALETLQDTVTVGRDAQETAADRQSTFGSALTREQVDALSDDPNEMAKQLQDLAGADAVLRVDSFEGGRLPSKAQIKSIHITRDAFAAENHSAGGLFIDIITQPGTGPLRGSIRYNLRDGSLAGRNPFTPIKGPERSQNYGSNFSGSLIKERASFNVNRLLEHLEPREREIIRMRAGLDSHAKGMTLEEIGQQFGITKERVRQLNARAMKKLRSLVEKQDLDLL